MGQVLIFLTGVAAAWLNQDPDLAVRGLGSAIGLLGQPAWLISTVRSSQWGMFCLSVGYTAAFAHGTWAARGALAAWVAVHG